MKTKLFFRMIACVALVIGLFYLGTYHYPVAATIAVEDLIAAVGRMTVVCLLN
jgi:hypothetical protein